MTKTTLLAAIALGLVASAASAQQGPPRDMYGDATVSKADAEKQAGERFAMVDANKDGVITEDEVPGPMARGFSRMDADGNGKVTKDEFTKSQLSRFDMMDADHDGQLTKAERDAFMEAMRARMGGG